MRQAETENKRAAFALKKVKAAKQNLNAEDQKKYKAYAKQYPSMVLVNGLAATVAFAMEKKGPWAALNENIAEWLKEINIITGSITLEEFLCNLESVNYRIVTNEVLALFEWLRRFASGMIEGVAHE
jgi:CRISPR-associated protein Cmr5